MRHTTTRRLTRRAAPAAALAALAVLAPGANAARATAPDGVRATRAVTAPAAPALPAAQAVGPVGAVGAVGVTTTDPGTDDFSVARWRPFPGGTMKPGVADGIPVIYFHFTWSRTWAVKNRIDSSGGKARATSAVLCAAVPTPAGSIACNLAVQWKMSSLEQATSSAVRHKRCLAARAPLGAGAVQIALITFYTVRCDR